jgi:phenylpropionate dioxygenase-like ring-hydroxylating dioxygenase large terminal subunit
MNYDTNFFAKVRQHALEAESLPPACYTDPQFFAAERDAVFMKAWNFIGHDDQVKNTGDYIAFELAGVHVIVARGRDGVLRAFANTCRHRGCRILKEGGGNLRAFKCGYHGWVYALDGRLTGAPLMEHTKGFDKADYGLVPIRLEQWGRFMFVNFDANAKPLKAQLGDLVEKLAPYNFDDMVLVRRREVEVGCNWKVYYENLQEPYHTPYVHPNTLARKNEDEGATMMSGNSGLLLGEGGDNAPVKVETGENYTCLVGRHVGSRGLLPGDEPLPPIKSLEGRTRDGSIWSYVYPATTMSCQREGMWYVEIQPLAIDRCRLVLGTCFPKETVERSDFEERVEAYYKRLDMTTEEDLDITQEQQAGLSSPFARPGRVCHLETMAHAFRVWLAGRVAA